MTPKLENAITIRRGRGESAAINEVMEAILSVADDREIVVVVNSWPLEEGGPDERFIR